MQMKLHYRRRWKVVGSFRGLIRMFGGKKKLKKEFDERLLSLMLETKSDWEHARKIENHLNDYEQEVIVRRKIAESKYFYLFKEAKIRQLGSE